MNLIEKDNAYIWHPYTQHKTAKTPVAIAKAEGALVWDVDGKEYIDAIASWWVNPFGHSNKFIADAIYAQLTTLEHVLFGGFTHEPAIKVAEQLLDMLPSNQQKVFFSDNGSTAVEVAIKASLQYFFNKGEMRKTIIAFEDAFHGDTFAAMAASGISLYTQAFKGMFIDVVRIPVPTSGNEEVSKSALKKVISENDCAAFIFEPLVLGAAGMVMYEPEILDELISICKQNNVLTIADEVMTGFGKTGKTFACDYLSQQPDAICLSKALTGGTIPMAITTFTQEIFDAFYSDDINKALFHGHTFTANPTGCAAALAAFELLASKQIQNDLVRVNKTQSAFAQKIAKHPKVKASRVLGTIMAFDIKTDGESAYYGELRNKLYDFFIRNGVILRPVGNTVYVLPPYVMTDEQLEKVYSVIEKALEEVA
ncbi:adenosylmethionine--8-amino-7-oxononanoate transaminase [Flavobacterium sp. MAH-1]|uniref:Adenosylmethionine-8-amino-7-oxononanoate aminotransferase n=1 Tax=Flavobacterium agri TaxID=2743471 RepID=A0A7Y8Y0Q6_9FLAO|nr:adenosylmethionine--8-amino-7-oxononanoate transaminase [Flavobacterium agri]NUY80307.1 adenosylmethionine--8-amino-7-oxononanoate transaminase [Flavobacterium agri]NYA70332.1 adenosylmethionine--8-amino-7-oxononanoate transaminase [Flavobacterium agri]